MKTNKRLPVRAIVRSEAFPGRSTETEASRILKALEFKGQAIIARLIEGNRRHIGTASDVVRLFGFSSSNLHRLKDDDRVICYRPEGQIEFLFPLDQFAHCAVHKWAGEIVAGLGNGGGVFHFIFVPRDDLGSRSFMDLWRERPSEANAAIREAIAYLTRE